MELRKVDPRSLVPNPKNRNGTPSNPAQYQQLLSSIHEIGLIQPPTARERDGQLFIVAGHRRTQACIELGAEEIYVLVTQHDARIDQMRSFAENVVRENLSTVDIWRGIVALEGANWNDEGIATALNLPPRTVRKLKLCGSLLPAILDRMAEGDEPNPPQLATIASAPLKEQAEAWKANKPKKGEGIDWHALQRALVKTKFYARDAAFDDATATAFGIVWIEDLFDQGDQDSRHTVQAEDYLAAQHEWMQNHLPKKGVILELDANQQPKLPAKAVRVWGTNKSDSLGHYVNPRSGKIDVIRFQTPAATKPAGKGGKSVPEEVAAVAEPAQKRAPVTQNGEKMIGDFQTEALHKAFAENSIDDHALIGLLVLTLCGNNVEVRTSCQDMSYSAGGKHKLTALVAPDGTLTRDPETLRQAARAALRYGLSLSKTTYGGNSGAVARIAGSAIDADQHLPNMATEDFMSCLSKDEIESVGAAHSILPRQTGKATRQAVIERLKNETYVYPGARFALTASEVTSFQDRVKEQTTSWDESEEPDASDATATAGKGDAVDDADDLSQAA
jgi:ParB family transcriptional regulator, chromosome partitioning protein